MRHRNTRTYKLMCPVTSLDNEGNRKERFKHKCYFSANISPISNKMQIELYGERVNTMLNMITDNLVNINLGDAVCVETQDKADFRVISIKKYTKHKLVELERIM